MTPHTPYGNSGANSFDTFIEENFPTVYRFAFCMSLAPDSAAHLTQTAFAEAQRAQHHDSTAVVDKLWLLATLHHEWAGHRGLAGTRVDGETPSQADLLIQPKHVAGLDQGPALEILHGMKEKLRLALSLFYFEQLSYGEIAEILETTPEIVLANLAEAKTAFRLRLEENRRHPESLASREASEYSQLRG